MKPILDKVIFSRDEWNLPDIKIDTEFKIDNTHVYTLDGKLIIESVREIDEIDSSHEIKRYIRPQLLIIQGVLSYFSAFPFTVYDLNVGITTWFNNKEKSLKAIEHNKLIIEGKDYTKDLNIMLEKLSSRDQRSLVITLLDRWRKAIFMQLESEVNTYHDEAILTHFHILELLVDHYYDSFRKEAIEEITEFVKKFASEILNQRGNNYTDTVNSKTKILKEVLISEEMSVGTKLIHLLKQYNMLDDKTYSLVNRLVKIRNSIAHGRIIYRDKLIWPLPPFFNLTTNSDFVLQTFSIFTARLIALHLDISTWGNEWKELHQELTPSDEVLVSFVKSSTEYMEVSPSELIIGSYKGVKVSTVVDFFIENPKKCSFVNLEKVLGDVIKEIEITEENTEQLFMASIILGDSLDSELSSISKKNVETIHSNRWLDYSNIKDILRYLDFHGIKVNWFKSWLQEGGHINI